MFLFDKTFTLNFLVFSAGIMAFALPAHSATAPFQFSGNTFIENKGQLLNQFNRPNNEVLFIFSGNGINIQLRKSGYSYELFKINNAQDLIPDKSKTGKASLPVNATIETARVDVDFKNCNANIRVTKEQKSGDYSNYYTNGHEITHVYSYNKITYHNIYSNTDIEFLISEKQGNTFKYNIILRPGADISEIQFLINGASEIKLKDQNLEIKTPLGLITEKIPYSYYTDSPHKDRPVDFKLEKNRLTFSAPDHSGKTLVIDPTSNLIWATYYGGSVADYCTSTGSDAQDNIYIAGHSMSTSNIATSGSYQSVLSGSLDGYLAKFNEGGMRQWASYFGGAGFEQIFSMFVEPGGNVYLSGDTYSSANIATQNAHQTVYGGGIDDALLVKFTATGIRAWSTYFGGVEHDISQSVTVDNAGNVIMTGHTQSANMATSGAYNPVYNLGYDVFVAKFNTNGALYWCTYYGDTGVDESYGVATDGANNVYITGITQSIAGISTNNAHQVNSGGLTDAYIAKFNSSGTNLVWATYYGGSGDEFGSVIRVKNSGTLFIGGNTTSNNNMATAGAYQVTPGNVDETFLACFNLNGQRLWGTYFGGEDTDYMNDLRIDASSNIIICGQTLSTASISLGSAYQPSLASIFNYDAYIAKFSGTGQKKLATYFGGIANDNARSISINSTGKIYMAGETTSTLNVATVACHQPNKGGAQDGFLAKFCIDIQPLISPRNATLCMGNNTLTATNGYSTYLWNNGSTANPLVTNNTSVQGTFTFAVFVTDGYGCSGASDTASVYIANCYVSLSENEIEKNGMLYPVPSSDFIHLQQNNYSVGEKISLSIFSITGQLISEQNIITQRDLIIDLKDFLPGVYILHINSAGKILNKKFIKN